MEAKTESVPYLAWMKHLWAKRHRQARKTFLRHRLPWTGDWVNAVRIVQRVWPGTSAWLLSCSSGEGGHGPFVMNYQGSGAGGWMQYMEGTFNSHISAALYEARTRHLAVPPANARGWTDPLGQAFAAGWARWHHATGAWDPGIDAACA